MDELNSKSGIDEASKNVEEAGKLSADEKPKPTADESTNPATTKMQVDSENVKAIPPNDLSNSASALSEVAGSGKVPDVDRSETNPLPNVDITQSIDPLPKISVDDCPDDGTSKMYAEVASLLADKVLKLNDTISQQGAAGPPNFSTQNQKNESLSLIMSYEDGTSSSGEETEKENDPIDFTTHRYKTISVSSGCLSGDGSTTDDEETPCRRNRKACESDLDDEEGCSRSTKTPEGVLPAKSKLKKKDALRDPLMLDQLPPIEKLAISVPEEDCVPVGKVYSIVDRLLVIESLPDTPVLMLDSVIFTREGSPIGQIFDIFGHVKRPFYSIRFNTCDDIGVLNVSVGRVVYCAPKTDHTKYVFTHDLLREKGSDASWQDDLEPPPNCVDFSDDEAERAAKKGTKVKKEKEVDSPARRRHLSFEQQMNRNNTLRNRAFKRDSQGEARNWDVGWHNYKKSNMQFPPMSSEPPPPPPRQIQQPVVFSNPAINSMNLVIRPSCFNPVVERPIVNFQPSSSFQMNPSSSPWTKFEPPPTPPHRNFQRFPPPSPPHNSGGGAFQPFEHGQVPPNVGIATPFSRFPPSSPASNPVFHGFGTPSCYGPPPSGFGPPPPSFSSPPPPQSSIPIQQQQQQPQPPSRFINPSNGPPSLNIPPPPFNSSRFPRYHPSNSSNSNNPNNFQPPIPRIRFPSSSNNNHPPPYNHMPF